MLEQIKISPEIYHRNEFPLLCNWRKLFTAIEVGVDKGEWSKTFMEQWQGNFFIGVDDYKSYSEMPWDRTADLIMTTSRYERFGNRAKLINLDSRELANYLATPGNPLKLPYTKYDFIYLDGAHDKNSVLKDVEAWWPIVSDIGILAGHDYDDTHLGVKEALHEFLDHNENLVAYLTEEELHSWYIYKGGMPGYYWTRNERGVV